jgi:hypothetical protein
MSEAPSLETLGLKKPLDKMTAKELRQMVMDKLPQISGVSGMDKEEIVKNVKEFFGISEEGEKTVSPYKAQISTLKKEIKAMRASKVETEGRKTREIARRKINKLKKRTRRLAKAL